MDLASVHAVPFGRCRASLPVDRNIGGFVCAIITTFKKEWAAATAPAYAVLEGLALGAISSILELRYPGIAIQSVSLTFGTLWSCCLPIGRD